MESITSATGLQRLRAAVSTLSASVSANRWTDSERTPSRSARIFVCRSDSSPET